MKYALIDEKGSYALILRGKRMTQYAVVHGLDKDAGSWDWTWTGIELSKMKMMLIVTRLCPARAAITARSVRRMHLE